MFSDDASTSHQIGERIAKIVDTMMPSLITRALDPNNVPPKGMEELEILANIGGFQFTQVDAKKAVEFRAMDFDRVRRNVRTGLYGFLESSVDLTDEQLMERYTALQQVETDAFEELNSFYESLLGLGYEPAQALSALKAERITDADLAALATGSWRQGDNGVVSASGIERNFASAVQRANFTRAQYDRYKNNIIRLARLVDEGRIQARE
jgi:hypothetical protein